MNDVDTDGPRPGEPNAMNGLTTDLNNSSPYKESFKGRVAMNVPERIVLSAGYDGDDNANANLNGDALDDGPIFPTEAMLGGMRTPPNMLTIDDSTSLYPRNSSKTGRHAEGDGSDHVTPLYKVQKTTGGDDAGSDADSDDPTVQRALAPVGQDDMFLYHVASEAEASVPGVISQLQRRVFALERELSDRRSSQWYWNVFLFALTVINPVVLSMLLSGKKR